MTRLYLQVGSSLTSGQKFDVWGSQIELASNVGPYVATSALPVLRGQDMTNLLPSSQQLSGPSWGIANAAASANSAAAPDGTQTAATLTANSGSTDSYVTNSVPNPSLYDSQTVTGSVYLRVPSGTLNTTLFLINVGENGFSIPASVPITVTTSWQRFSVTGTNQNGLSALNLQIAGAASFTSGQVLQLWGTQMVIGSSAAPYTPTPSSGGATNIVTGPPATLVPRGLSQTYQYDSFGNILQNGSFNDNYTTQNQLIGYAYDASGNLLSNGLNAFTWDAEGRMQTGGGATYLYDTEGNRISVQGVGATEIIYFAGVPIARANAGTWTDMIYGPQGLMAEVAGSENADPQYRLTDQLGSAIGQVGSNGILANPIDYTPFGQLMAGSTGDPYQYTGFERDQETNLDHATFRQYSSAQGRWMAPDPYLGSYNFADPQSFNRYSYVRNSPLSFTDPDGLAPEGVSSGPVAGCVGSVALGQPEGCAVGLLYSFFSNFFRGFVDALSGPSFHGSLTPRPSGAIWDEHGGFSAKPYSSIAGMIGDVGDLSSLGCEFGACGGGGFGFQSADCGCLPQPRVEGYPYWLIPVPFLSNWAAQHLQDYMGRSQSNEWTDRAKLANPLDPCSWLRGQLNGASTIDKMKINQALKYLNCKNVGKDRGGPNK
jgi:RHS repeat-associated protein